MAEKIIGVDIVKETAPEIHLHPVPTGVKFRDLNNGYEFKFQGKKFKKIDKFHVQAWHEPTQQYVVVSHIPPDFLVRKEDAEAPSIIVPGSDIFGIGK